MLDATPTASQQVRLLMAAAVLSACSELLSVTPAPLPRASPPGSHQLRTEPSATCLEARVDVWSSIHRSASTQGAFLVENS
jgi:hypothetical protein